MKKDKEFLSLVMQGNEQIIDDLKKDKELKNIKDNNGRNIFHYLMAGKQTDLSKVLLDKKLVNYKLLFKTVKELINKQNYKNDNYYDFFTILKDIDKEYILKKEMENIIKNNNIKTFNTVEIEKIIESKDILHVTFPVFAQCNDEMLETSIALYQKLTFDTTNLKSGFYQLRLNKIRTSILMENLNMYISPLVYEELNNVNEYCAMYLENRNLYNKLDKNLKQKEQKQFKKI